MRKLHLRHRHRVRLNLELEPIARVSYGPNARPLLVFVAVQLANMPSPSKTQSTVSAGPGTVVVVVVGSSVLQAAWSAVQQGRDLVW